MQRGAKTGRGKYLSKQKKHIFETLKMCFCISNKCTLWCSQEQVEAARKGLDQAKEEGLKLHQSSDNDEDDYSPMPHNPDEASQAMPVRRTRKHKEKGAPSTRASGRLRGTPARVEDETALSPASTSAELDRANASLSSPSPSRQVPERRGGQRGRPPSKEAVAPATASRTETSKTPAQSNVSSGHTDPSPASPLREAQGKSRAILSPLRQSLSPPSSVPSAACSLAEHTPTAGQELGDELKGEVQSGVSGSQVHQAQLPSGRERGVSVSSGSICSPEHQSDLDSRDLDQQSQHSLTLSPSTASRSPRKRQSADGEVLRGLPEDSPSAKVLRKLPGRLVTVVEEKEKQPRRRRRRGSGGAGHTEGSSEEAEHTESERDTGPSSPDKISHTSRDKDTPKSPSVSSPPHRSQEKEQVSPTSLGSPGKVYHHYSPTHHSPDMPVLRNLPVRRRLETESRMAAQLGEQHGVGRGRGHDRRQSLSPNPPRKQDLSPTKDSTLSPAATNTDNPAPVKRKPGRPPKRPVEQIFPPPVKPVTVEKEAPVSPKRKRGRPRKDSTIKPDATSAAQPSKPPAPTNPSPPSNSNDPGKPSPPDSTVLSKPPPPDPTAPSKPPPLSNRPAPSKPSAPSNPLAPSKPSPPSNSAAPVKPPPSDSTAPSKPPPASDPPAAAKSPPPSSPPDFSKPPAPTNPTPPSNPPPSCSPQSMQSGLNSPRSPLPSPQEAPSESAPAPTPLPSLPAKAADTTSLPKPVNKTNTPVMSPTLISNSLTNETPTATLAQSQSGDSQTNTTPTPVSVPPEPTASKSPSPSTQPTATSDTLVTSTVPALPVEPKPSGMQIQSSPAFPSQANVIETSSTPSTYKSTQPSQSNTQKTVTSPPHVPQSTSGDSEIKPVPDSGDASTPDSKSSVQVTPSPTDPRTDPVCAPTPTPAEPEPPPASEPSREPALAQPTPQDALELQEKPTAEELAHKKTSYTKEAAKTESKDVQKYGEKEMEAPSLGPQSKRRRVEGSPEDSESIVVSPEVKTDTLPPSEGTSNQSGDERKADSKDEEKSSKKRAISRQSSQDSVRSSSPSSVSSSGNHSSKRMGDNRATKRKRGEAKTGASSEGNDEKKPKMQRRRSNSPSSSSSDSEDSSCAEKRLTRSERKKQEKENQSESDGKSSNGRRGRRSKKEEAASNATGGDSGSETSTKVGRKSSGLPSTPKSGTNTPVPSTPPPQPEVLGKRCSALNAAAKLLAMRGRAGDTPRPSNKPKIGSQQESPTSSEKSTKSKGKGTQGSPQTNSSGSRGGSGRQTPTNTPLTSPESSRSLSRSTRQRPGSLLPPLDAEKKSAKRDKRKNKEKKEDGEDENRESRSSRGHSACSSVSSDRGPGSSRSRSSSNSSQRTPSLSSQSTEPPRPQSRAASSGSDTERGKQSHSKSGETRGRKSHRETRSQKQDKNDLSGGSAEGTPDRVLRSVAALAAAQARSPACNTRSSATQQRQTKT